MKYSPKWKKADPETIKETLKEMRMMYYDGEIDITQNRFLRIELTKDSAGENGLVYNWDVYIKNKGNGGGYMHILGDAFQYSEEGLFKSLENNSVI